MKAGLEIYISIVLVTIMAVLCSTFIIADVNAADARDAYYAYYTEIDNSDCAQSVINACIADAGDSGYELQVEKVGSAEAPLYKLTFTYPYKISMLGINKSHDIVGFIREQ
jgi:hypothetical protein